MSVDRSRQDVKQNPIFPQNQIPSNIDEDDNKYADLSDDELELKIKLALDR